MIINSVIVFLNLLSEQPVININQLINLYYKVVNRNPTFFKFIFKDFYNISALQFNHLNKYWLNLNIAPIITKNQKRGIILY